MADQSVTAGITSALGAASKAVTKSIDAFLKDAGAVARREIGKQAPVVPGADRVFSRWRGKPKLTVAARKIDRSGLLVAPRGPWGVAEGGAGPHAAFAWGHPFEHPGTRASQGRRSWTVGREATARIVERDFEDAVGDPVVQAFERG